MTAESAKRQTKRLGRVVLGASVPRDKADLIEEAADLKGETVSGYIGAAAIKRAERDIARARKEGTAEPLAAAS
jgi:uncharacterized protein (DUF1778 family)